MTQTQTQTQTQTSSNNVGASETPRLCVGRCGFFGTADKDGYCSKCYNPELKDKDLPKLEHSFKSLKIDDTTSSTEKSVGPPRCCSCKKKLPLSAAFACRCKRSFCAAHRLPEDHACTHDYQRLGKDVIKKQNPICKADKLVFRI